MKVHFLTHPSCWSNSSFCLVWGEGVSFVIVIIVFSCESLKVLHADEVFVLDSILASLKTATGGQMFHVARFSPPRFCLPPYLRSTVLSLGHII